MRQNIGWSFLVCFARYRANVSDRADTTDSPALLICSTLPPNTKNIRTGISREEDRFVSHNSDYCSTGIASYRNRMWRR